MGTGSQHPGRPSQFSWRPGKILAALGLLLLLGAHNSLAQVR